MHPALDFDAILFFLFNVRLYCCQHAADRQQTPGVTISQRAVVRTATLLYAGVQCSLELRTGARLRPGVGATH